MWVDEVEVTYDPEGWPTPYVHCVDCPSEGQRHEKLFVIKLAHCYECGGEEELCQEHYQQAKSRMP